jgi:hypothetical protein
MKLKVAAVGLLLFLGGEALPAQQQPAALQVFSQAGDSEGPLFFPENFARGYLDFEIAPPHNEIDVGLCAVAYDNPLPSHPTCTAYARYAWKGYLELQPFGRGLGRRLFFFVQPKVYGGDNLPQENYTASGSLILWERTVGVGIELPGDFELRLTNHHTHLLGRYRKPEEITTLRTDGPYGQYTTIGVRWYFGGWGRNRPGSM